MKRLAALILFLTLLLPCAAHAANRFAVCTTTCTWDAASTAMWSTTTGGATGASVPSGVDAVIFDAATCVGGTTCTITVNTSFTVLSITFGCTGTTAGCILDFSVNNNSPTIHTGFLDSGSGTKTVKLGSGTFTVDNTAAGGTSWQTNQTGTVVTAGTSTIAINGTANTNNWTTIFGNGKTYYNLTVSGSGGGRYLFNSSGGATTFNNITISGKQYVLLIGPIIVNGAFSLSGTSSNPVSIGSNTLGAAQQISGSGTWTASFAGLRDLLVLNTGATATNSMNFLNTSGITFPGGGGGCILGGWLLWRDFPQHINDNYPAWIDQAV